ncbi:MAG TPA: hypothetical protein VKA46_42150, partial [Gemmataceae bacterium]|nr:hypothetical protein [Gemmataceae bacterium]
MPRWLLSLARRFGISARTTRKARKRTFPSPLRIEELEDRLTPSTTLNLTLTGPTYAVPGSNATYVVTLANTDNNNNAAANVILGDGLPSGTTLASQTQVSGPSLSLGTFVGNPYDTIATLPAGSSVTVDIVAALNSSLSNGATLTDTAGALTSTQLSGSSVTSASVTTTVQSQADLAVSLSAPCTALPGANIAWTLTVSNNGPNAAQ